MTPIARGQTTRTSTERAHARYHQADWTGGGSENSGPDGRTNGPRVLDTSDADKSQLLFIFGFYFVGELENAHILHSPQER